MVADAAFVWEVPVVWSMSQASAVPCDYAMVAYTMYIQNEEYHHDGIILVGAASPIGTAAASMALSSGHKVVAVVNSTEEMDFVIESVGVGQVFKKSQNYMQAARKMRKTLVIYAEGNPEEDLRHDLDSINPDHMRAIVIGDFDENKQGEIVLHLVHPTHPQQMGYKCITCPKNNALYLLQCMTRSLSNTWTSLSVTCEVTTLKVIGLPM